MFEGVSTGVLCCLIEEFSLVLCRNFQLSRRNSRYSDIGDILASKSKLNNQLSTLNFDSIMVPYNIFVGFR